MEITTKGFRGWWILMSKYSRIELKKIVRDWLIKHLSKNFQGMNYKILLEENLGNIYGLNSQLKFKVDVLAIIEYNGKKELIMINIMNDGSSIGLKNILEMRMMCQAAKPIEAYLLSTDGLAKPIQTMMYSQNRDKNSLKYSDNAYLELWRFNAERSELDGDRPILPYFT